MSSYSMVLFPSLRYTKSIEPQPKELKDEKMIEVIVSEKFVAIELNQELEEE